MHTKTLLALLFLLGLLVAPAPAFAEEEPMEEPGDEIEDPDEAEEAEFEWLDDLDEARAKAKEAGKGLLVYLTPDWFT